MLDIEINRMLYAWIKSLSTLHSPLLTLHYSLSTLHPEDPARTINKQSCISYASMLIRDLPMLDIEINRMLYAWIKSLSTLHYSLSTIHSPLSTLHSPLSTLHSPLSTLHSPLFTLHSPLSTLHSPLSTLHSPLSTIHSPLSTIHSPLLRPGRREPGEPPRASSRPGSWDGPGR